MKRMIILLLLGALLCCPVSAINVSAGSAVVMDAHAGKVLWEKNAQAKSLIASTTKIMTALVVLEHSPLDETVTVSAEAVGVEGSSMYLAAGEKLTVEDLLYGLMLLSGNDAAEALAYHVSGSIEAFAELMNQKADVLGLHNTRFANPHGLDSEDNYSNASDMARLAAYALENEEFRRIVSSKSYSCGTRRMTNHNKLLWDYEGAVGVKTGYTKKAGRILVGAAEKNGRRLITVTISAPDDWKDHKAMLDLGFSKYTCRQVLTAGTPVAELAVMNGLSDSVSLIPSESISGYMLEDETVECQLIIPPFVYAPLDAGARMGSIKILVSGLEIGKVDLVTECAIGEIPSEKNFLEKLFE